MAPDRLAPDVVLNGTYRIVRLLGRGGVGEVYEAIHDRLAKKRFAVKVLIEDLAGCTEVIDRFKREAEILSELGHPNIVQIADFAQTPDGLFYLVMEFVDGLDLAEEIRRHGRMPPAKAAEIIGQLASALEAVHRRGIIHRDLKPQNVILTRLPGGSQEVVKILDFGIAKVREATVQLTRQNVVLGTPQYMAPEQASGHVGDVDERTDQFSLAAIAYEIVTGEPPFGGQETAAILYRVVHEPPNPFRLPLPATERAILRAMSKDKAHRFAGVREFHRALAEAAAIDGCPPPAVKPTLVEKETLVQPSGEGAREPTAILAGTSTTLSKAAGPLVGERTARSQSRRWTLPTIAMVTVAGVVVGLTSVWRRGGGPETPSVPTPPPAGQVPRPAVVSPPSLDASAPDGQPAEPVPSTIVSRTPQTAKPAARPGVGLRSRKSGESVGKTKPKIRNEDL